MKIVVSYRGAPRIRGWETGAMLARGFRQLGHDVFEYGNIYKTQERLKNAPDNLQDVDLLLYCEMNDADPQYLELKNINARKTACSLYDTSYHQDRYRRLVDYFRFDHLFLANPLTIHEYKTWGYDNVSYLPYACDRELHGRSLGYPKTMDVALVGSIRNDRMRLIRKLNRLGLTVELVSDVFREEYIDTLASSRIILNQNPRPQGLGLLNMRSMESIAAGDVLFTEADDLEYNLKSGFYPVSSMIGYRSPKDLVDILPSILAQYNELRSVGQQEIFKYHTYQNRVLSILQTMFPYEMDH